MKAGAFVATFIAVGLIAYQHQPSLFGVRQQSTAKTLPTTFEVQAQLLTYSKFSTLALVKSSANIVEVQLPVDSLFFMNSTSLSPEADRQFSELVKYLNSFDPASVFEVSILGVLDAGFNPKFRSNRARKLAEAIKKAGVAEQRIEKVWQVVLDDATTREIASEAGPNASLDFAKNQYISVRIRTSN